MEFGTSRRDPPGESIVPMINVVFLLLIFFLMTATIAPPEPFEVTVPTSLTQTPADIDQSLHVGADGQLAWGQARGEAVFAELAAASTTGRPGAPALIIRADRHAKGAAIAALLARLATIGIINSQLVVSP